MIRFIDGQLWISISHWHNLPLLADEGPAFEDFNFEKEMRKVVREVLDMLSPEELKRFSRSLKYRPNDEC